MGWPTSQDYNEALQNLATSFNDPDLRDGSVSTNAIGLPTPFSGNFADVYEVRSPTGQKWAVKCFTREVAGLSERYRTIDLHLKQAKLPFTVGFQFLEEGIRIHGRWYPALKMQWVEGQTINAFVRERLDRKNLLEALAQIWIRVARRLREAKLAHGDLQHGNALLVPGGTANSVGVKLIDYDGMIVPDLLAKPSGEVGHPAYQHPERARGRVYSAEVDRFPHLVIVTALRSLWVGGRQLWEKYDNGDNLLFREADLKNPHDSALFRELEGLDDSATRELVHRLGEACLNSLDKAPWVDQLVPEGKRGAARQRAGAASVLSIPEEDEKPFDFGSFGGSAVNPQPRAMPVAALVAAGVLILAAGVVAAVMLLRSSSNEVAAGSMPAAALAAKPREAAKASWQNSAPPAAASSEVSEKSNGPPPAAKSPEPELPAAPPASNPPNTGPPTQPANAPAAVYLADLNYVAKRHSHDWFATNGTVFGKKFTVNGMESPHGIFVHSDPRSFSEVSYQLRQNWKYFRSGVAVPHLGDAPEKRGIGSALTFEVLDGDKLLWASQPIQEFDKPQWCAVDVENVAVLRLRVRCPGDAWCARTVWIEPRLTGIDDLPGAPGPNTVASSEPAPSGTSNLHVSGLGPRRPLVWVGPSWHIDGATLVQNRSWVDQRLCFGDVGWSDYDLTCEVRRTSPQNNLGVIFRATGDTDFNALILCPTQAYADIHRQDANPPVRRAKDAPGVSLATGVWRKLRIEVRGFKFRCFLDGAAVLEFEDEQRWNPRGGVGFWSWNSQGEFRDLKVAAPDGKALWEGWPDLRALGNERAHYVYQHDNGAKGSIRHLNGKVWEEKTPSGTFRFTEIERSPEIIGLERPGPNGKILLHLHWGHAYVSGGREWKRWATGNWQR